MNSSVLLMAHGTPSSIDEMAEYLTIVRGGRTPSAELVEEMRGNYRAIGGRSPLTDLTEAQAAALRDGSAPKSLWRSACATGAVIKDAVAALVDRGVSRIVGIPMAPQYSTLSVQK